MELHKILHQTASDISLDDCFLTGTYTQDYLNDMKAFRKYADEKRIIKNAEVTTSVTML